MFIICGEGASYGCGTTDEIRKSLVKDDFRYFIVHLDLISAEELDGYLELFTKMFGFLTKIAFSVHQA